MNELVQKELAISCICSIYQGTKLEEFMLSIDSILLQKYVPEEIIIIVDGPINFKLKLFIDYLKKQHDFIRFYFFKENKGLGNALNFGINKCKNNLIARFDSDDINLENRLKIQYDFILANPQYSIVGSNVIEFNDNTEIYNIKNMQNNYLSKLFNLYMLRNPINHPSVLMKKEDIINVGSYRDIKYFEDYELWLRCIKNGLKIYNINQNLVAMRRKNYLSNRRGTQYARCELKFLKVSLKQKQIKRIFIPFYIFRLLVRIMPEKISNLILFSDQKRVKKISNRFLNNYIDKIMDNNRSLSKKYTSKSY